MNNPDEQQDASASPLSHDEISRRAEALWREYGCPTGRDQEIWLEAERQLVGARTSKHPLASEMPSSGTFGGPQNAPAAEDQPVEHTTPSSQTSELMKEPATTTAARRKARDASRL